MALIFAFAALNVYAGINSGDEPYEFEEGLSDGGTYYYRTKILNLRHPTLKKLYLEVFSFCIRKEYIR